MTRAIAIGVILLAGAAQADDELLSQLHNATAGGGCARAAALVREIEAMGEPRSLVVLGERIEQGRRCLPADPAHAARLYQTAAAQGEAVAMARLGRLHAEGRGVPEDARAARRWFRAAVLETVLIAPEERERLLRMALADGAVPRLLDQQLTWLGLIELGGARSVCDLALRLYTGDGIAQNERAAERLMGKLAAEGYPPGWYHSGLWQLAKARNREERKGGLRSILEAAYHGHLPAMVDLAHRMLEGSDFEPWDVGAYVLFLMAAERGASVANELALLRERLDFIEIDVAKDWAGRNSFPTPAFKY